MLTTAHTTCKYSDNMGLIKKDTPKSDRKPRFLHLGQAEPERILPMWDSNPEIRLDFRLVEHRECRADSLYRIVFSPARKHFAEVSADVADLPCEVVP